MKKSEFKQLIREEIQSVLKEEAPKPKYKKGDTFHYKGSKCTVTSDNGYIVNVQHANGEKATYNHNQLKHGVFKKDVNENEGEGMSLENLPKYKTLPDSFEDQGSEYINLPSTDSGDGSEYIRSKASADRWVKEFMSKFKLDDSQSEIKFKIDGGRVKVVNSKDFTEWRERYLKDTTKAYSQLNYKGD